MKICAHIITFQRNSESNAFVALTCDRFGPDVRVIERSRTRTRLLLGCDAAEETISVLDSTDPTFAYAISDQLFPFN